MLRRVVLPGDRYERRDDGAYVYVGRVDDMLKVGGLWVSPIDMEHVLLEHPRVAGVGVVGVTSTTPQRIAAYVECAGAPGDDALADELRDMVPYADATLRVPPRGRVRRRAAADADRQGAALQAARAVGRLGRGECVRAAVIGAGPSGFYATDRLLEAGFEVDLYDSLPTPFGLVRSGVAPDHPKIKSVTRVYEKTAAKPGFRFFGGVVLGRAADARRAARALPRGRLRVRDLGRPTGSASRARTGPGHTARPSSSPGTTATPTRPSSASTSRAASEPW